VKTLQFLGQGLGWGGVAVGAFFWGRWGCGCQAAAAAVAAERQEGGRRGAAVGRAPLAPALSPLFAGGSAAASWPGTPFPAASHPRPPLLPPLLPPFLPPLLPPPPALAGC
jgi:hypothetical protein